MAYRRKDKESYRIEQELLKYDLVITNKQSNLRTAVKNASLPYLKKLINSLEPPLRDNLKKGEAINGRKAFKNRFIKD